MLCNFAPAILSQFAIQVDTVVLPALEGGKVHQVLQGHFIPERHKSNLSESVPMSDCQQSLYHKPKS